MTKLLVAAAFAVTLSGAAPAAQACTLDTCWFTAPVCARADCHHEICIYSASPSDPSFCVRT